jgi:hypothetical protein
MSGKRQPVCFDERCEDAWNLSATYAGGDLMQFETPPFFVRILQSQALHFAP